MKVLWGEKKQGKIKLGNFHVINYDDQQRAINDFFPPIPSVFYQKKNPNSVNNQRRTLNLHRDIMYKEEEKIYSILSCKRSTQ